MKALKSELKYGQVDKDAIVRSNIWFDVIFIACPIETLCNILSFGDFCIYGFVH